MGDGYGHQSALVRVMHVESVTQQLYHTTSERVGVPGFATASRATFRSCDVRILPFRQM